jgi:hypothetical protein
VASHKKEGVRDRAVRTNATALPRLGKARRLFAGGAYPALLAFFENLYVDVSRFRK